MDESLKKILDLIKNPAQRREFEQFFKNAKFDEDNLRRTVDYFNRSINAGKSLEKSLKTSKMFLEDLQDGVRGMNEFFEDSIDLLKAINSELKGEVGNLTLAKRLLNNLTGIASELQGEIRGLSHLDSQRIKSIGQQARLQLEQLGYQVQIIKASQKFLDLTNNSVTAENLKRAASETTNKVLKRQLEQAANIVASYDTQYSTLRNIVSMAREREAIDDKAVESLGFSNQLLTSAQKILGSLGLSGLAEDFREVSAKLKGEITQEIQKQVDLFKLQNEEYKQIQNSIEAIQQKLDKGGLSEEDLKNNIKNLDNLKGQRDTLVENVVQSAKLSTNFNELSTTIAGIGPVLTKALRSPLVLLGLILSRYNELDRANVEFQRLTGQNAKAIAGMNTGLVSSSEVLRTMAGITERINMNVTGLFTNQQLGRISESAKLLGMSEEQTAGLAIRTKLAGQNVRDFEDSVASSLSDFNTLNNTAVPLGQVLKDVAGTTDAVALSLGSNPLAIARATAEARRLGMELSQLEGIADQMLDFESSIQAELEAQLLTGKDINLARAREFALTNDLAGLAQEIRDNNVLTNTFANATRIEQQSMAKALGMSREDLARMIALRKLEEGLSAEAVASAVNMTKEQVKQLSAMDKLTTLADKFAQAIAPLADLLIPFLDGISYATRGISSIVASVGQFGVMIREAFGPSFSDSIEDSLDKVEQHPFAKLLKFITGGAVTIGVASALGGFFLRGTRSRPTYVQFSSATGGFFSRIFGKNGTLNKLFGKGGTFMSSFFGKFYKGGQYMPGGQRAPGGGTYFGGPFSKTKTPKGGTPKGRVGRVGRFAKAGGLIAAAAGLFSLIDNMSEEGTTLIQGLLKTLDQFKFTALGAIVGSIVPGLGTAVGATIGGLLDMLLYDKVNFQDSIKPPKMMAEGGIVSSPTNAMVGESGTEAVVPLEKLFSRMDKKFDELIAASSTPGIVTIDGNKAGQYIRLASTNLS